MNENKFDDLKQYLPDPETIGDLRDWDIYVFTNNITAGKFVMSDKLTKEEKEVLAEKLNDEWVKTVLDPYTESLVEFCKKYEMAVLKTNVSLGVAPLDAYTMQEKMKYTMDKIFN